MNRLFFFFRALVHFRGIIWAMSRRALASQFVGSVLGFVWVVVHPLILIAVFWVVFGLGFKQKPLNDVPFVAWLTAGLAAWSVFASIISGSVGVVVEHRNLIKKMAFPSQILPVVKLIVALVNHLVLLAVMVILLVYYRIPFSLYIFQFLYYLLAVLLLGLGMSWGLAALNPFFRDVSHLVQVFIQVGFWATPIFWELRILPEKYHFIEKLNPMFYIVQGYRESFFYAVPFWAHPLQTIYFWGVVLFLLAVGGNVFRLLKPHFAEVL